MKMLNKGLISVILGVIFTFLGYFKETKSLMRSDIPDGMDTITRGFPIEVWYDRSGGIAGISESGFFIPGIIIDLLFWSIIVFILLFVISKITKK